VHITLFPNSRVFVGQAAESSSDGQPVRPIHCPTVTTRKLHRILGLVMLLPFAGWAVTGVIFFIKPGYGAAYEQLSLKTYPLDKPLAVKSDPTWLEVRYLKTILGEHLLVRTSDGWQHLDPVSRGVRLAPAESELRALINDAFTANPERYGRIVSIDGPVATTDTGVRATVSWNRLSISQRGKDTDRIDTLYKIHYLQWTGVSGIDKVAGAIALASILILSGLGLRLFLRS
jgi:hypothetical protein